MTRKHLCSDMLMCSMVYNECNFVPTVFLENCSMQRKGKITHDERLNKVSETTQTSRIDFGKRVIVNQRRVSMNE